MDKIFYIGRYRERRKQRKIKNLEEENGKGKLSEFSIYIKRIQIAMKYTCRILVI
jgi:hypothetical protein